MTIDVAIISQFRPHFLKKCLVSLANQSRLPDQVILVLHSDDRETRRVVQNFKGVRFMVKSYKKKGYAPLRNLALKASDSDFLYFLDDDCVPSSTVIEEAVKFLSGNSRYAAVQGKTINLDTSFYSQFAQWTNSLWLERLWDKKKKTLRSIDTKNVCLRRKAIRKMRFFECFGSEDVDFGLQTSSEGEKIGFNPKMIVFHQEQANNLLTYLKKRLRMMKGIAIIKKKWGKLPCFYSDRSYENRIRKAFRKSKYKNDIKYRLFLESVFLLRKLRMFYDSLAFQCKSNF